jgi:hypothetical protein
MDSPDLDQLARVVIAGLAAGREVEIDGLGIFRPDERSGFCFDPQPPRVFIAYAREDRELATRLYSDLLSEGFSPWMDTANLIPGQNWPRAIECAIETADFFVACFSRNSTVRKGGFQAELRFAMECARRIPLDDIFLAPVRLDECRVPRAVQREVQYVDLFPDWSRGVTRLAETLRREDARRLKRLAEMRDLRAGAEPAGEARPG